MPQMKPLAWLLALLLNQMVNMIIFVSTFYIKSGVFKISLKTSSECWKWLW